MTLRHDQACQALEPRTLLAVPLLGIKASDSAAAESSLRPNPGAILIERSGKDLAAALDVSYAVGGTASADDFSPLSGLVTIPAGKRSALIPITAIDDAVAEPSETVVITLLPADTYSLDVRPAKRAATVTIADNEPVISISRSKDASEGKITPTAGEFTVRRACADLAAPLRVDYSVAADSTATSGDDFAPLAGFIEIPAGKRYVTIIVTPIADLHPERAETLRLILTAADRYRIESKSTTATIRITDVPRAAPLSLLGWDRDGTRAYAVTQTLTMGGVRDRVTGTVTHTLSLAGDRTNWTSLATDLSPPSGSIDPTTAAFERRSDGVYFVSLSDAVTDDATALTFAGLRLCGPSLTGSVSASSAAAFTMTYGTLTGTASSKLALGSMETVTTAAGTFDTVRLTLSLQFKGSGRVTVNGQSVTISLSMSETFTFWTVDGAGPVRYTDVSAASISGGGITQRISGTATATWNGR